MLHITVLALAAYLIGSIPFGFMIGTARGVDLRRMGSGNIGATNVYRALGLGVAILVFIMDVTKGFAGTRILPRLWVPEVFPSYAGLICGMAAIVGSVAGVFMRFRGGKGVATAVGVFLGLQPLATAICLGIWVILLARFRYVSLGSISGAVALPIMVAVFNRSDFLRDPVFFFALIVALIVTIRHRANIRRLLEGTEKRVGRIGGHT